MKAVKSLMLRFVVVVEFGASGYTRENVDLEGFRYVTPILVLFSIQCTLLNKIIMNAEETYRLDFGNFNSSNFALA